MRYPGGKGGCYRRLISLMPPHDVFIETHLGGGAVIRHKKPAARNVAIDVDPAVIAQWPSDQFPHVEAVLGDAVSYLQNFPFHGREMVYADPPYLPATRRREHVYRYDYAEADHVRLVEQLKRLPCPVLLSGYDSELYNDLLGDWTKATFTVASHSGPRQEVLWLNYAPPSVPHDLRYLGGNFREREQIKRRHFRLRARIERLSPAERAMIASWLARTYPGLASDCEDTPSESSCGVLRNAVTQNHGAAHRPNQDGSAS